MNNKLIKTVDEHNIDRDGLVLFSFQLDGNGYVCYSINRDEEQDNLFISRVIKNFDDTFTIVNIDSNDELDKLKKIVMSLVEYAVDRNDKNTSPVIHLSDGEDVSFIDVFFNKDQKIEVRKSYVTTVEKKTSKKTFDIFNNVKEEKKNENTPLPSFNPSDVFPSIMPEIPTDADMIAEKNIVNEFLNDVKKEEINVAPVLDSPVEPVKEEIKEQKVDTFTLPNNSFFSVPPIEEKVLEDNKLDSEEKNIVSSFDLDNFVSEIPVVEPVVPVSPVKVVKVDDSFEVQDGIVKLDVLPKSVPVDTPKVDTPEVSVKNEVETPKIVDIKYESTITAPQAVSSIPFVFDASNEVNLNDALSSEKTQTTMSVDELNTVRDFGVDVLENKVDEPVKENVKTRKLTKKAGFANSKMLFTIAIFFFLSSCAFLGYEIFNFINANAK